MGSNDMFSSFNVIMGISIVVFILIFIFTILLIFSPKVRSKIMKKQLSATKYMLEESKETLEDIATVSSDINVNSQKKILDKHEGTLTDIATRNAAIKKEGIEMVARSIKDGLTKDIIYCKHCGKKIDTDSKFCKFCGKNIE